MSRYYYIWELEERRLWERMKEIKEEYMKRIKVCQKCGHIWITRTESPKICPKCKLKDWNIKIIRKKVE